MDGSHELINHFLKVRRGDLVVVADDISSTSNKRWWIGRVIHVVKSARGSEPSLFQISCIDTGIIRVVNADLVIGQVNKRKDSLEEIN